MVYLAFLLAVALSGVGVFAFLQNKELKDTRRRASELYHEHQALLGRDDFSRGYEKGCDDTQRFYADSAKFLKSNYSDLVGTALGFVQQTAKRAVIEGNNSPFDAQDLETQIVEMSRTPPKHATQVSPPLYLQGNGADNMEDVLGAHS